MAAFISQDVGPALGEPNTCPMYSVGENVRQVRTLDLKGLLCHRGWLNRPSAGPD